MLAWHALQQYDETGQYLSDILSQSASMHQLSSNDRAAAVDIASGVMRRRRTLDTLLESQVARPRDKVEADLWRLLQLGAFQVVFSRTPDHAAVDSTVELAREAGRHQWSGFVNGIIRNIARSLRDDYVDAPSADAIPIRPGRYRGLHQKLLPDPVNRPSQYIGQAFSLPETLAERWTQRLSWNDLLQVCFHSLEVPHTVLRVNRLVATVAGVRKQLLDGGVESTKGAGEWAVRLSHGARIFELPGFREGLWSVQDESAMLASELLAPKPGERILDLCAAPGGKSTHLAELSEDNASIIACDVAESRLHRISENADRLNLKSIQPRLIDRDGHDIPVGPYDAVLVDVPCSNTGVLSRRPEARWRFRVEELDELVQIQTRLLLTAFEHVRSGGRIVYSTCSIEPEETTDLVSAVTKAVRGLTLVHLDLQIPSPSGDGAFRALLQKSV